MERLNASARESPLDSGPLDPGARVDNIAFLAIGLSLSDVVANVFPRVS